MYDRASDMSGPSEGRLASNRSEEGGHAWNLHAWSDVCGVRRDKAEEVVEQRTTTSELPQAREDTFFPDTASLAHSLCAVNCAALKRSKAKLLRQDARRSSPGWPASRHLRLSYNGVCTTPLLGHIRNTEFLLVATGRPRWIRNGSVIDHSGCHTDAQRNSCAY